MSYRVLPRALLALAAALFLAAPAMSEEAEQGARQGATIVVDLPAEAHLTFDGESTVSTGSNRLFVSPPLTPGKVYSYTVRAEWKNGDKTVSATKKITVRAGQETRVGLGLGATAGSVLSAAEGESGIRLASGEERKNERLDSRPGAERPGQPLNMDLDGFLREYDKNKDGGLTRDELPPELRSSFDRLDANKDGKVSMDELRKGMHHLRPARRPSDLVQVLIEMSDCDDVCHGEVQRAYDILRKLDSDHDGKINPDELKAARAKIVENRVDYLFKELDANKDGKISHEEAKGMMLKNFAEIDSNKDGFIDRAELTRAATERPRSASAGGAKPPQSEDK